MVSVDRSAEQNSRLCEQGTSAYSQQGRTTLILEFGQFMHGNILNIVTRRQAGEVLFNSLDEYRMGVTCPVAVFEFVNVFSAIFISMIVKIYSDSVVEIHVIPYVQLLAWQWQLRAIAKRQKPRGVEYACTRAHTDTPACQHELPLVLVNKPVVA